MKTMLKLLINILSKKNYDYYNDGTNFKLVDSDNESNDTKSNKKSNKKTKIDDDDENSEAEDMRFIMSLDEKQKLLLLKEIQRREKKKIEKQKIKKQK